MKLYLSDYEKNQILKRMNKLSLELSYEAIIHKKVFEKIDFYMAVPKGLRSLLYFTYFKSYSVAVIINLNKYNKFEDVKIFTSCFDERLAIRDTLFYGYEFMTRSHESLDSNIFFACTDVFFYMGEAVKYHTYSNKMGIFNEFFREKTRQVNYCDNSLIIGIPVICSYKEISSIQDKCIYEVNGIMYIKKDKSKPYGISYEMRRNIEAVFKVRASIKADIYYLYYKEQDPFSFYEGNEYNQAGGCGIAHIDSYKTSLMMNSLFRNIKENRNLDLLEESDSEEDFENMAVDKYVDTKKIINMKCRFNNRFKKWQPIEETRERPINRSEFIQISR
jgi:hypothetical protein